MIEGRKVYVITQGNYSDYHICAVTLDLARAEELKKIHTDLYNPAWIEVFIEDEECERESLWEVRYIRWAKKFEAEKIDNGYLEGFNEKVKKAERGRYYSKKTDSVDYVYCFAKTEEQAIKIAQDRRAAYLAKMEGI